MLSLEVQQPSRISIRVVRGYSGFHSSRCWGIRPYLELRGRSVSFLSCGRPRGSSRVSIGVTGLFLSQEGKVGIPLESKQWNRPPS